MRTQASHTRPQHSPEKGALKRRPQRPALMGLCFAILVGSVLHIDCLWCADRDFDRERFLHHLDFLTAMPHRLAGSENLHRAADYVHRTLEEIGIEEVFELPFWVWGDEILECFLEINGERLPLYPMRPNLIAQPVTPPEGFEGDIIYASRGAYSDFPVVDVAGKIVVLDYNSPEGWRRAFALGALAVIYVDDGSTPQKAVHHGNAPANFPRFYAPPETARSLFVSEREEATEGSARLRPTRGKVVSAVRWKARRGRNVIAYLPPAGSAAERYEEEVVVIAAPLDTYGDVPQLTGGARTAANVAGLLEIARVLHHTENRRPVLVAFLDGEGAAHAGARTFYLGFHLEKQDLVKKDNANEYAEFLRAISAAVRRESPLEQADGEIRRALLLRLRNVARSFQNDLAAKIRETRLRIDRMQGAAQATILQASVDTWLLERREWNEFRRLLDAEKTGPDDSFCSRRAREEILRSNAAAIHDVDMRVEEALGRERLYHLLEDRRILVHLSLNLSDRFERWGLVHGGSSPHTRPNYDVPGAYGRLFHALDTIAEEDLDHWPHFDRSPFRYLQEGESFTAGPFSHSGEVAPMYGLFHLSFMTLHDPRPRDGHPADIPSNLDQERLVCQMKEVAAFISRAIGHEEISVSQQMRDEIAYVGLNWDKGGPRGPQITKRLEGQVGTGSVPPEVLVSVRIWREQQNPDPQLPFYSSEVMLRTDEGGFFEIGPLCNPQYMSNCLLAASFDERGSIVQTNDQKKYGHQQIGLHADPINFIDIRPYALAAPPGGRFGQPTKPLVLEGHSNATLMDSEWLGGMEDNVVSIFFPGRYGKVKVFGKNSVVVLNMNPDGTDSDGMPLDRLPRLDVIQQTAVDAWRLNESRLRVLREKRVTNDSLEWFHGEAADLLQAAEKAPDLRERVALQIWSHLISRRIYGPVLDQMNDLVHAVVLLLFLSIPFAFALERLLFNSPRVYAQVGWFFALFLVTFMLLYASHPAFQIASSPLIVFLAFAIVLLSGMVLYIIVRRFQVEVKTYQGLEQTVHSADVSRTGTLFAAVQMGISSMRRRPVRTAFTAVTVILLTFSILSFASFGFEFGVVRTPIGPPMGVPAVLVHHSFWQVLPDEILEIFAGRFGEGCEVVPRYWWASSVRRKRSFLLTSADGIRIAPLRAAVGVDARELERNPGLRQALGDPERRADGNPWIVLPDPIRKELQVQNGDFVQWKGSFCRVAGRMNPGELAGLLNMDGSSILPIDYESERGKVGEQPLAENLEKIDPRLLIPVGAESVAFIDAAAAERLGGELRAFTIYPADGTQVGEIADEVASVYDQPVFGVDEDGTHRFFYTVQLAASGWQSLIFPLLLGGLIVLGTMLGSVTDRQREIYTFSAIGLAPRHVAGLFFAEAAIYAILGGQGGYLLSQGVTRVLGVLAERGLVRVPELNYSSTNAIITILIVMATVLISTIYPAFKASRGANPGIQRQWRIPPPKGDVHDIVFPFTVSEYDLIGIVSFLKEHMDTYQDASFGRFMTRSSRLELDPETKLPGISAQVSLAPFDLGISQDFTLRCAPSEISGIDEVRLHFQRRSGTRGDWKRSNRRFIEELRQQLLIWRALTEKTADVYRSSTLEAFPELEKILEDENEDELEETSPSLKKD
jgi:hypothetical protein